MLPAAVGVVLERRHCASHLRMPLDSSHLPEKTSMAKSHNRSLHYHSSWAVVAASLEVTVIAQMHSQQFELLAVHAYSSTQMAAKTYYLS